MSNDEGNARPLVSLAAMIERVLEMLTGSGEKAFAAGFVKQMGNIQLLMMTVGSVVFFTLLLVTGNTMAIAVREAQRLRIPIIGLVDTNCDPDGIDYVIPGNDDSSKAITLYARGVADAILEGRANATNEVAEMVKSADDFVEVSEQA